MDISGRKALVTGAGDGIGHATALMLAENGISTLVLVDINEDNLAKVKAEAEALGASVVTKAADLRSSDTVLSLYDEIFREAGVLDIVHNNAGIMAGQPFFPDQDVGRMIDVINLNLMAMMVGSKVAIDRMRAAGQPGVIINTASVAAFNPMPADPAYATSKVGILRFVESCKPLRESDNIRVMAVCPGIVDTAIVPHDAEWLQPALQAVNILKPADIANAVKGIIEDESLAGDQVTVQNEPRG